MLSFVIPVYNEEDSLVTLCEEILQHACSQGSAAEVIFVDDGSSDQSWARIQSLSQSNPQVHGIKLARNFGKAAALACGFKHAHGEWIFTLDADLQDHPENIAKFLDKATEGDGYDLVSGYRHDRQDRFIKRLSSWMFNRVVSKLTKVDLKDHNCGFKLYRQAVVSQVPLYGEMHRFIPALAASRGFRVGEIPISHRARPFGKSKYGPLRILYAFFDLLTVFVLNSFRHRPMHFLGGIGMLCFLLGGAGLTYLAGIWLSGEGIGGRPLIQYSLTALLLGCQFLIGGVIAELLTAVNTDRNPAYRIAENTDTRPTGKTPIEKQSQSA